MAALQRAVALAEMDGVALAVSQHLHLDMAGMGEIFLEIDGVVAERGARLVARGDERGLELVLEQRELHAAPAAAGRGLDQHRIADVARNGPGLLEIADQARARHHRDAEFDRALPWP